MVKPLIFFLGMWPKAIVQECLDLNSFLWDKTYEEEEKNQIIDKQLENEVFSRTIANMTKWIHNSMFFTHKGAGPLITMNHLKQMRKCRGAKWSDLQGAQG